MCYHCHFQFINTLTSAISSKRHSADSQSCLVAADSSSQIHWSRHPRDSRALLRIPPMRLLVWELSGLTGTTDACTDAGKQTSPLKNTRESQCMLALGWKISSFIMASLEATCAHGCQTVRGQKFSFLVDSHHTSCPHAMVISSSGSLVMHI